MTLLRRGLLCLSLVLLLMAVALPTGAQPQNFAIRILHTNDHHAHLEPVAVGNQMLGGIAQRKTLVDKYRAENAARVEPLLLLDAGDVFQGTLFFNQYNGQADLYFYNALDYDGVAVGNHEFDKGQQVLADFISGANFPMLSANIEIAPSSPLYNKIKPWVVMEVNGEKVGVFGLTTEETPILSSPGPGVSFTNYIAAARKAVAELQGQGVNKIVAVTHLGILYDIELARNVDGIDVIVGGHSHSPVGNMPNAQGPYPLVEKTPNGTTVLIVTDWEWGKYLGDIRLFFDQAGQVVYWEGEPHPVDGTVAPDPAFEAKLKEFAIPINELRAKVIGSAVVMLNGERADVRTRETNLGNLIADAILEKARPAGGQVALMNGGGIRASIPAGNISVGQVIEVLPFGNTIATVDVSGAQLKQALENGVSQVEQVAGRFPQIAGMRFVWDPAATAGSRVIDLEVRGQDGSYRDYDPGATYRVVTNNFMITGGDGYTALNEGGNKLDTGFLLADVVMDYIAARSPANPQVEGRIIQGSAPFAGTPPALPPTGVEPLPVSLPDTGVEPLPVSLPDTAEPAGAPATSQLLLLTAALLVFGIALRLRRA